MMASFMSYFGGRRDPKQSARDAIVTLRQQLQMIEKKEEHLQKRIEDETKKAKANAVSNKASRPLVSLRSICPTASDAIANVIYSCDCCFEAQEGYGD